MTTRTAHCSCGDLRAVATGEPEFVIACHCLECQRRTGSVFGVGAYYPKEQVSTTGEYRSYTRAGASGRNLEFRFCPRCGTTVFWTAEMRPDHVALAVGAMGDPTFRGPHRSVWETSRHAWVEVGANVERYPRHKT